MDLGGFALHYGVYSKLIALSFDVATSGHAKGSVWDPRLPGPGRRRAVRAGPSGPSLFPCRNRLRRAGDGSGLEPDGLADQLDQILVNALEALAGEHHVVHDAEHGFADNLIPLRGT